MISNVNIETGQGLATEPAPFKPGERIAVEYMPIAKIIENNVAVLAKAKPKLSGACGAKTETTVMMPFFVRGGFRVKLSKAYKIPRHYVCVRYTSTTEWTWERCLPDRDTYLHELPEDVNKLADLLIKRFVEVDVKRFEVVKVEGEVKQVDAYVRAFKHLQFIYPVNDYFWYFWWTLGGVVKAPFFAVYEFISPDEAKLVDDVSRIDYVAMFRYYGLEDRRICAGLKIYGDGVVWADSKSACCRRESTAVAGVIARYGAKIYVAKRTGDGRYEVEEWLMNLPPSRIATYYSDKAEPMDVSEQEVV